MKARRIALAVAALGALGCLVGGMYLLADATGAPRPQASSNAEQVPAWRGGIEGVLSYHMGQWPSTPRVLLALAGLLALATAALRLEPDSWRRSWSGAAAWAGLGALLATWAAAMPRHSPALPWTMGGLGAGFALGLLLGRIVRSEQALRDGLLTGVAGIGLAWAVAAALT